MAKTLVCTQCGFVGQSSQATRGNGLIEIVLWLTFIIPGLIYSIWRRSSPPSVCSQCKSQSLIPVDSPRAKKILEDSGQDQTEFLEKAKEEKKKEEKNDRDRKIFWAVIFSLIVIVILYVKHLAGN
jgi:hypothetical protein